MNRGRTGFLISAAVLLCGCHLSRRLNPDCHVRQEYQRAQQMPVLKVPEGLDSPNTQGALSIPAAELAPPPPGPKDQCLDIPPRYKPAPANKAASPG
ncbi:MAG: hypothetical protein NVSMB10_13600 [Steroidobacteraceae bacterium]